MQIFIEKYKRCLYSVLYMRRLYTYMQNIIKDGVDLILPPRCPLSGDVVDSQGMISAKVWGGLDFIAQPYCQICGIPFDFESGIICMDCLDSPAPFRSARSALIYNNASRDLILGFKHGDKTHMVKSFVSWLKKSGANMLKEADYIIPVPLHRWRLLARRYNQAALMGKALSSDLGIEHLPMALQRIRSTPSQGHLGIDERIENVKKAFAVNKKYKNLLKDKKIILIDDVYTSGATVKECSMVLIKSGVREVNILTLARVLRSDLEQ